MAESTHALMEMTWTELAQADFTQSVLFLPIAPLEEHGPHLPLGTDCLIAQEAATRSATMLAEDSLLKSFVHPVIPVGYAYETSDFPGTLSLSDTLFVALVEQILGCVASWGFHYCVIVSPHASLTHLCAIHAGIRRQVKQNAGLRVSEPLLNRIYGRIYCKEASNQTETQPKTADSSSIRDIHAGAHETQIMLHLASHLVRTERLGDLPPRAIADLRSPGTWKQKGAVEGYLGNPAIATPANGDEVDRLLTAWAKAARELFDGVSYALPQ